jgi:hypothetical protein
MGLSEVHFKPNLHIFPYLETEVIFFSSKHTYLHFGYHLNRDDCELF